MGEGLLVYANRILAANDAALSHIRRPEAEGLVRLGTPDDYATYLLPPVLAEITKNHPRIQFEVLCDNATELLSMLGHGDLDVVVATHPLSAVAAQIARHEPLHWVASPNYVDDPKVPLSLVLFPSGCVCRDIALDALKKIDRPWHVAYSTRSISLMEHAMLNSSSVSAMEASIIPPGLKIIDGQPGFPALPEVVISVHRSGTSEPHVSLVADILLEKLETTAKKLSS